MKWRSYRLPDGLWKMHLRDGDYEARLVIPNPGDLKIKDAIIFYKWCLKRMAEQKIISTGV